MMLLKIYRISGIQVDIWHFYNRILLHNRCCCNGVHHYSIHIILSKIFSIQCGDLKSDTSSQINLHIYAYIPQIIVDIRIINVGPSPRCAVSHPLILKVSPRHRCFRYFYTHCIRSTHWQCSVTAYWRICQIFPTLFTLSIKHHDVPGGGAGHDGRVGSRMSRAHIRCHLPQPSST